MYKLRAKSHENIKEDTSPVSQDELKGFYSFGVATEAYAGVAGAVFWPIILKALSSEVAMEKYDHNIPCNTTGKYVCDINLFGETYLDTSSLVLFAGSLSVFLQLILFIGLGSLADHGNHRKQFMIGFVVATAIIGMLVLGVVSNELWWLAYLIYIFANVCFGASHVFSYSWVPVLTRYYDKVIQAREDETISDDEYWKIHDREGNVISAKGFFYGYVASLAQVVIAVGVSIFVPSKVFGLTSTYTLQVIIAGICVFMLGVTLFYTNPKMKYRPGPPLPKGESYFTYSFKNLWSTLKKMNELSELFKFLAVWFVYSDAYTTLVHIAILFSQSELGAPLQILLAATGIFPIAAGLGNIFWVWFQRKKGLSTKQIIFLQCLIYAMIPVYGLVGFLLPKGSFGGLTSKYELPVVAFWHGFILGATSSSCRVLFSELLPHGHEAEFFGLYEITDKGSSWIGPLVVAGLTELTGSLRYSFWFILASFMIPLAVLPFIDTKKGKSQATEFHAKYDAGHLKE